jgi:hypothetical protein
MRPIVKIAAGVLSRKALGYRDGVVFCLPSILWRKPKMWVPIVSSASEQWKAPRAQQQ